VQVRALESGRLRYLPPALVGSNPAAPTTDTGHYLRKREGPSTGSEWPTGTHHRMCLRPGRRHQHSSRHWHVRTPSMSALTRTMAPATPARVASLLMTTSYRGEGLPRTAARGEGEDCHTHSPVLGEAHQKHPHFREESPESVPAPSKFTADRRKRILELLSVGPAAAPPPRCPASTTPRFSDGSGGAREASERSRWEQFYRDVLQAEAHPEDPGPPDRPAGDA
jgi:hypothetical protein